MPPIRPEPRFASFSVRVAVSWPWARVPWPCCRSVVAPPDEAAEAAGGHSARRPGRAAAGREPEHRHHEHAEHEHPRHDLQRGPCRPGTGRTEPDRGEAGGVHDRHAQDDVIDDDLARPGRDQQPERHLRRDEPELGGDARLEVAHVESDRAKMRRTSRNGMSVRVSSALAERSSRFSVSRRLARQVGGACESAWLMSSSRSACRLVRIPPLGWAVALRPRPMARSALVVQIDSGSAARQPARRRRDSSSICSRRPGSEARFSYSKGSSSRS